MLFESIKYAKSHRNFTVLQILVLIALGKGPSRLIPLASLVGSSQPALSRALDRLGVWGLARRTRDRGTQQITVLATTRGLALVRAMEAAGFDK